MTCHPLPGTALAGEGPPLPNRSQAYQDPPILGLMSTDIDVFPSSPAIPTVGEFTSGLRHLLQAHAGSAVVRAVFGEAGVSDLSPLVELLDETPGRSSPARSSDPALLLSMPGYDYGWISLDARRIGFDF